MQVERVVLQRLVRLGARGRGGSHPAGTLWPFEVAAFWEIAHGGLGGSKVIRYGNDGI